MSIVAGVDFGTLSVRIALFDKERGKLASASAEYPLKRSATNPDFAMQSHADQMDAMGRAMQKALQQSGGDGQQVAAMALDTTGASVIIVGERLKPLGNVVNAIGTFTCIFGLSAEERLVPGVCGVLPGSVVPQCVGIEAGGSAVGDVFGAIVTRAGKSVQEVPLGDVMSLGSGIFAFLETGDFASIEEAQDALCPEFQVFAPQPEQVRQYERMFPLFRTLYFALGSRDAAAVSVGQVLPELRALQQEAQRSLHLRSENASATL